MSPQPGAEGIAQKVPAASCQVSSLAAYPEARLLRCRRRMAASRSAPAETESWALGTD